MDKRSANALYWNTWKHRKQGRSISRNHEIDGQHEVHKEKWTKEDDKQRAMGEKGAAGEHGPMLATGLDKQLEGRADDKMRSPGTI